MEKINVVGLRGVSFDDEKTGRNVSGTSVFYTMEADNVEGLMAGKIFVSAQQRDSLDYFPKVGEQCWVDYNRYGKVSRFERIGK